MKRRSATDKFILCLATLREMLHDRGYRDVPEFNTQEIERTLRPLDLADSVKAQRIMNSYSFTVTNAFDEELSVYWLCGKIGKNSETLDRVRQKLSQKERPHTLLFVKFENCTISAPAKKDLATIPATIEYFDSAEILFNLTKHESQPKFKVLTQAEAEEVKRKYGASGDKFPKMRWDDPIRRYYGMNVDDIIQIKRFSENGREISYRVVLKAVE